MTTAARRPQSPKKKHKTDVVKFVVTGLSGSGKTRFIDSVSQYTEWKAQPNNSWYFGRVRVDQSLLLHFYEPPTERRFDFIWLRDLMSKMRATGYIVMVDSTRPQAFGEFLSIVYTIRGFHYDVPIVVAANKQDCARAWSADDIRMGLGMRDIAVRPCVAHNRALVRDTVVDLLYQVM